MTLGEFHSAIRVLRNISPGILYEMEVLPENDQRAFEHFSQDPVGWFINATDNQVRRVWELIQHNQPDEFLITEDSERRNIQ